MHNFSAGRVRARQACAARGESGSVKWSEGKYLTRDHYWPLGSQSGGQYRAAIDQSEARRVTRPMSAGSDHRLSEEACSGLSAMLQCCNNCFTISHQSLNWSAHDNLPGHYSCNLCWISQPPCYHDTQSIVIPWYLSDDGLNMHGDVLWEARDAFCPSAKCRMFSLLTNNYLIVNTWPLMAVVILIFN